MSEDYWRAWVRELYRLYVNNEVVRVLQMEQKFDEVQRVAAKRLELVRRWREDRDA